MIQKQIEHPVLGSVLYTKRTGCKTIRVLISPQKGIRVSLPLYASYAAAVSFVDTNLDKIIKLIHKQKEREQARKENGISLQTAQYTLQELKEIRKRAHEILPQKTEYFSKWLTARLEIKNKFGFKIKEPFKYGRIAIKNNRSNWGSCSSRNNINLNMHLVNLPGELCDFVIIHELCHLVHHNHSPKFHQLVDTACDGREKELSQRLRACKLK